MEFSPSGGGKALRRGMEYVLSDGRMGWESYSEPLKALVALDWMERALKFERAMLVAQARAEGSSWGRIAQAARTSKQNLHSQYRQIVEDLTEVAENDDDLLDYIDRHFDMWGPLDF